MFQYNLTFLKFRFETLKEICLKESFFCGEREKNSAGQKEER
jgi:hypothetical protein